MNPPARCFKIAEGYAPKEHTWVWMPMGEVYEDGTNLGNTLRILEGAEEEILLEITIQEAIERVQHEGLRELLVRLSQ